MLNFFPGLIFATAQVVFITAKIVFIFTSLSAVHIYDFHVSTAIDILTFANQTSRTRRVYHK